MPAEPTGPAPSDARRRQILDAARGVFATTPYMEVTSAQLADAAGVTRALLHHYAGGRREIFLELVAELREAVTASIRPGSGAAGDETLAANADAVLDTIEAAQELLASVIGAAEHGDPEVAAALDAAREAIVDRILINQTGTAAHPEAVRLAVRGYLGLAEVASREWLRHGRATRQEVHTLLVRALPALVRDVAAAHEPRDAAAE